MADVNVNGKRPLVEELNHALDVIKRAREADAPAAAAGVIIDVPWIDHATERWYGIKAVTDMDFIVKFGDGTQCTAHVHRLKLMEKSEHLSSMVHEMMRGGRTEIVLTPMCDHPFKCVGDVFLLFEALYTPGWTSSQIRNTNTWMCMYEVFKWCMCDDIVAGMKKAASDDGALALAPCTDVIRFADKHRIPNVVKNFAFELLSSDNEDEKKRVLQNEDIAAAVAPFLLVAATELKKQLSAIEAELDAYFDSCYLDNAASTLRIKGVDHSALYGRLIRNDFLNDELPYLKRIHKICKSSSSS